jgi:1-acyl-sn-glycerol-3-phosphate acyltransferase
VDYLRKKTKSKIKTMFAYSVARRFMNYMVDSRQLIIKDIVGIENYKNLDSGAVVTCNHFNAFDSFAMQITYEASKHRKRKLYRVINEGNYTSFPGFYGMLMRNCNTLPLSSSHETMKKFMNAVDAVLQKGHFVLVYPEQSMWWNYRKPKPLKRGAFDFAAKNNVPVLPIFITMEDSDVKDRDGFFVQEYTIHIGEPIYPDNTKSKRENAMMMMEENARVWKEVYEEAYQMPLEYTCDLDKAE